MTSTPSTGDAAPAHSNEEDHELDIEASAMAAVARTRAHGLHYYGQVLGIRPSSADGGPPRPQLAPDRAVTPGPVPPVSLATLADLAMGSAVRAEVGAGRRLGTVSMTLHHLVPVVTAPVVPTAHVVRLADDQRHALARVDCTDADGTLVCAAQGWFMALPVPEGVNLRLLPWEVDRMSPTEAIAAEDLKPHERAAVRATVRAAERARANGTSVSEELTAPSWDADASQDTARGSLRIGPELANRVGHVQGGALYGIGLAAAARAVADPDTALVPAEGSWQFLRPGDGADLVVDATIRRRGRSATFATVSLAVDGRTVGTGQFAFRPGPGA